MSHKEKEQMLRSIDAYTRAVLDVYHELILSIVRDEIARLEHQDAKRSDAASNRLARVDALHTLLARLERVQR